MKANAVKALPPRGEGLGSGAPLLSAAARTDAQMSAPPPIPQPLPHRWEGEPTALTPTENDQIQRGRVLILQHLHDRLDAAVADAYGWPQDLSNQEVLGRLVALNQERRLEEAAGNVRWLRPEYQAARFGRPDDKRETIGLDLGIDVPVVPSGEPAWPKNRDTQPFEVERAVRALSGDIITIAALARSFKGGGKKIEPRLSQILSVLADYGRITRAGEGRYRG